MDAVRTAPARSRNAEVCSEPASGPSIRIARASCFWASWYALAKSAAVSVHVALVVGAGTMRRAGLEAAASSFCVAISSPSAGKEAARLARTFSTCSGGIAATITSRLAALCAGGDVSSEAGSVVAIFFARTCAEAASVRQLPAPNPQVRRFYNDRMPVIGMRSHPGRLLSS